LKLPESGAETQKEEFRPWDYGVLGQPAVIGHHGNFTQAVICLAKLNGNLANSESRASLIK